MSARLEVSRGDGIVVVRATGEVDAFLAPDLRARLDEGLAAARDARLVLDLSRVEFLDSTALGTIVGAFRQAAERSVPFSIVSPRGHARRIFLHTRLDAVLPLVEPGDAPEG